MDGVKMDTVWGPPRIRQRYVDHYIRGGMDEQNDLSLCPVSGPTNLGVGIPIDSGMGLSIRIDKLRGVYQ